MKKSLIYSLHDCYANFSSDSYFIIPQWFKHLRGVEIYFWNREALIVSGRRVSLGFELNSFSLLKAVKRAFFCYRF